MISTELRRTSDCQWMGVKAWGIKEAQHKSMGRALQRHQHLQTQYHRIHSKLSHLFCLLLLGVNLSFPGPLCNTPLYMKNANFKKETNKQKTTKLRPPDLPQNNRWTIKPSSGCLKLLKLLLLNFWRRNSSIAFLRQSEIHCPVWIVSHDFKKSSSKEGLSSSAC